MWRSQLSIRPRGAARRAADRDRGLLEHLVGGRVLEHAREGVLARGTHHDALAAQALGLVDDDLGLVADPEVRRVGQAELLEQLPARQLRLLGFVVVERFARLAESVGVAFSRCCCRCRAGAAGW